MHKNWFWPVFLIASAVVPRERHAHVDDRCLAVLEHRQCLERFDHMRRARCLLPCRGVECDDPLTGPASREDKPSFLVLHSSNSPEQSDAFYCLCESYRFSPNFLTTSREIP